MDCHSGASDTRDLNHLIPTTACVQITAESPSVARLMLLAAGRAQMHNSFGGLMAPVGVVSPGLMVQIRTKETQDPESFVSWVRVSSPQAFVFSVGTVHVIPKHPSSHCFPPPGPTEQKRSQQGFQGPHLRSALASYLQDKCHMQVSSWQSQKGK